MTNIDILISYCQKNGCNYKINEILKNYTSFKIGGTCELIVFPESEQIFIEVMRLIKENSINFHLLGNGSNVLICENHFDGVFVITTQMNSFFVEGTTITSDCGTYLNKLSIAAKENALHGLEFAYGIPGTLGGAIYMNAGAYGGEISRVIKSSRCLNMDTLEIKELTNAEHHFSYRESIYNKNNCFVLSSKIVLEKGSKKEIEAQMDKNMAARKEKQPLEYPSAGSTFKRCEGYFTAKLIDDCGMKGKAVGGAMVSEKHAGFVINRNDASFDDVINLIDIIREEIYKKTQQKIECEIKIITF